MPGAALNTLHILMLLVLPTTLAGTTNTPGLQMRQKCGGKNFTSILAWPIRVLHKGPAIGWKSLPTLMWSEQQQGHIYAPYKLPHATHYTSGLRHRESEYINLLVTAKRNARRINENWRSKLPSEVPGTGWKWDFPSCYKVFKLEVYKSFTESK